MSETERAANHLAQKIIDRLTAEGEPVFLDKGIIASAILESEYAASVEGEQRRPRIICLCGSTKFVDTWVNEYQRLSDDGNIVLTVARMPPRPNLQHDEPELKVRLDELHKRKIDLADEVFVLNVGGYIGDSTRGEIAYAEAHSKPVRWLEPIPAEQPVSQPRCTCFALPDQEHSTYCPREGMDFDPEQPVSQLGCATHGFKFHADCDACSTTEPVSQETQVTPEQIVYNVAQRDSGFRKHLIEQLTAMGDKQDRGSLRTLPPVSQKPQISEEIMDALAEVLGQEGADFAEIEASQEHAEWCASHGLRACTCKDSAVSHTVDDERIAGIRRFLSILPPKATHWEGCETAHYACAITTLLTAYDELRAQLAAVRQILAEYQDDEVLQIQVRAIDRFLDGKDEKAEADQG